MALDSNMSRIRQYEIKRGAENAGQENDGQGHCRGWKMQDWNLTDKSAGLENDGQKSSREKLLDGGRCEAAGNR